VKTIDNLFGLGSAKSGSFTKDFATIARNQIDFGMVAHPCFTRFDGTLCSQLYDSLLFEVYQDGSITMAARSGPLVYPTLRDFAFAWQGKLQDATDTSFGCGGHAER